MDSLGRTIGNVFEFSLPMVFISVVVLASLRIFDIVKNKKNFAFIKKFLRLSLLYIFYVCSKLSLIKITIMQQEII